VNADEVRAFFAVELSEPARRAAAEVASWLRDQPGGRDVRWVRAEGLHVTLRFLGNVPTSRIGPLTAAAARAARSHAPFTLRLGEVHGFPSARRPRVVALSLEPGAPLATLAAAVESAVVAEGWPPEPRAFRAHVTLGRIQGRRPPRLEEVPVPACAPFEVRELVLLRSRLGPGGSTYIPLERIALGGNGHPASESTESREE
jgi:RNA 2',3'-cyclic 3'-phosphodiesterase